MTAERSVRPRFAAHADRAPLNYPHRVVYIRFISTHAQYDAIDAQSI